MLNAPPHTILTEWKEFRKMPKDVQKTVFRAMILPYPTTKQNIRMWSGAIIRSILFVIGSTMIGYGAFVHQWDRSVNIGLVIWLVAFTLKEILWISMATINLAINTQIENRKTELRASIQASMEATLKDIAGKLAVDAGRTSVGADPISVVAALIDVDNKRTKHRRANKNNPLKAALDEPPTKDV